MCSSSLRTFDCVARLALVPLATAGLLLGPVSAAAAEGTEARLAAVVAETVKPLMAKHDVPGMAIAVTLAGRRQVFNFGLADRASGRRVDGDTLFEIGSISKTFTATLGAYAETLGALSLDDPAGDYFTELDDTAIGRARLVDLATYTAGGLPLQFPDAVDDADSMVAFYRGFRPAYEPGTMRVYSNPSIGLFGRLAAESLGVPFDVVMEQTLFPAFGLASTHIRVPEVAMAHYAFGVSKAGKPRRVTPGVLDSQAYGVKTTAADLIAFVEANIDPSRLAPVWRRAVAATHLGRARVGAMTQALGWEYYAWPASLDMLLEGNSADMALKPQSAEALDPPAEAGGAVLFNKTGSTNGFGAYVAFVPARAIGVALLANRNYPIPERVKAAHRILLALDEAAAR